MFVIAFLFYGERRFVMRAGLPKGTDFPCIRARLPSHSNPHSCCHFIHNHQVDHQDLHFHPLYHGHARFPPAMNVHHYFLACIAACATQAFASPATELSQVEIS